MEIGDKVEIFGTSGTIRFIGTTGFATGQWVGIELPGPSGKNDGSVQGVRYFQCSPNYGVFVRFSQIKADSIIKASNETNQSKRQSISQTKLQIPSAPMGDRRNSYATDKKPNPAIIPQQTNPSSPTILTENMQTSSVVDAGIEKTKSVDTRISIAPKVGVSRETLDSKESKRLQMELELERDIKLKMVAKKQEYIDTIAQLRKTIAQLNREKDELASQAQDALDNLEMISLDKEMAEEKAETLLQEVNALKEKIEELTLDMELTRKDSAGELASQNQRLREALVRLRDVSTSKEEDYSKQVKDLERQLHQYTHIESKNEDLKSKLEKAVENIEILKQQLDDALEHGELVENLTQRIIGLSDTIEEQNSTIKELEMLRELEKEIEEAHQESEAHLSEEILYKDSIILKHQGIIERNNETIADYENTISQFRKLVSSLQNELNLLKDNKNDNSMQSRELIELNMQLQNSAVKAHSRGVEIALKRLDVEQAHVEVEILKHYLPEDYKSDVDSISTFLLFMRIAFKSRLVSEFSDIKQFQYKSRYLAALFRQIVLWIEYMDPEKFSDIGKFLNESKMIEKKMDAFLELVKDHKLSTSVHVPEIERVILQTEHLIKSNAIKPDLDSSGLDLAHGLVYICEAIKEKNSSGSIDILKSHFSKLSKTFQNLELGNLVSKNNHLLWSIYHSFDKLLEGDKFSDIENTSKSLIGSVKSFEDTISSVKHERNQSPWIMRAELIHKGHVELKGQLRELDNLKVQNSLKEEELKIHKERLEESEVKINLLEARMESLRKNSSMTAMYEKEIEKFKDQEKEYIQAIHDLHADIERLESAQKKIKKKGTHDSLKQLVDDSQVPFLKNILSKFQQENMFLKGRESLKNFNNLFGSMELDPVFKNKIQNEKVKNLISESQSLTREMLMAAASIQIINLEEVESKQKKWKKMDEFAMSFMYYGQETILNFIKKKGQDVNKRINEAKVNFLEEMNITTF